MRNIVYNVGKKMGKNFKPWEAVKQGKALAKYLGKAQKAAPYLAFAFDCYLAYSEEKEQDKRDKQLAKARTAMRREFRDLANTKVEAIRKSFTQIRDKTTSEALAAIDQITNEIISQEAHEKDVAKKVSHFIKRSQQLREKINNATL